MSDQLEPLLARRATTLATLDDAADTLVLEAPDDSILAKITARGYLRPIEVERIDEWFARYLTVRTSLRETIDEALSVSGKRLPDDGSYTEWCLFVLAYAAACQLVRLDRLMLYRIAAGTQMQRKLNEPVLEHRIPRKCYTRIHAEFVDRRNALLIHDAIRHVKRYRLRLLTLLGDPVVGAIVTSLPTREGWLDTSRRRYVRRLLDYTSHAWRRRGVVALSNALTGLMEGAGRGASTIGGHSVKRVGKVERERLDALLRPGDVLVTRHDQVLTNLFLPGFWPHVALYVGSPTERDARGIVVDDERRKRWTGACVVLEALKDGARFRPLSETLAVDHVLVLRPKLDDKDIEHGIARACRHEGKPYNFDFDFFNADRVVCTEVVYRGFDGIGGLQFPMTMRGGRPTLSAEDIVTFARSTGRYSVVATVNAPPASVLRG